MHDSLPLLQTMQLKCLGLNLAGKVIENIKEMKMSAWLLLAVEPFYFLMSHRQRVKLSYENGR